VRLEGLGKLKKIQWPPFNILCRVHKSPPLVPIKLVYAYILCRVVTDLSSDAKYFEGCKPEIRRLPVVWKVRVLCRKSLRLTPVENYERGSSFTQIVKLLNLYCYNMPKISFLCHQCPPVNTRACGHKGIIIRLSAYSHSIGGPGISELVNVVFYLILNSGPSSGALIGLPGNSLPPTRSGRYVTFLHVREVTFKYVLGNKMYEQRMCLCSQEYFESISYLQNLTIAWIKIIIFKPATHMGSEKKLNLQNLRYLLMAMLPN
jgi:hypothetical protein